MPQNPSGGELLQPPQAAWKDRVRDFAWRHPLLWTIYNLRHIVKGHQVLFLDYRVEPRSRYGYGQPAHPLLLRMFEEDRKRYREFLEHCLTLGEGLARIPTEAKDELSPFWKNGWMPPLDAVALYAVLALQKPRLYLEIGSGNSTKFARRAINDHQLATKIVSVDPQPRAEINSLCDRVVRRRLQDVGSEIFTELQPGDILFLDNSHVLLTNSDVNVAFVEILPTLPAGVFVQVHDVFLPYDYPPRWAHRYFSEQYMLAFALLEGAQRLEVVLPNAFVSADPELSAMLHPLWQRLGLQPEEVAGLSLWLRTR